MQGILNLFRDASFSDLVFNACKITIFLAALYLYFSSITYAEEIGLNVRFKRAGIVALVGFTVTIVISVVLHVS